MLTVTGPGLSASSCSRLPAANRVRGRVGPVQPAGAVLVRAVCRTAAAAAEPAAAALLLFCINLQLMCCWRATPPFLLLCLFRRDGMTEQQDWWRGCGRRRRRRRGSVCLDRTRCSTTFCDPDSVGSSNPEHPEGSQTAQQIHKHAHSASLF